MFFPVFILFVAHCASRICSLISFISFGNVSALISSDILDASLSALHLESIKNMLEGFPGGAVVKNPPANAGDTGSSPGPG